MKMQAPDTTTLPLDGIKPYWRNPRMIPDEAVNAVAESIDTYGYLQPVVVDADHVIVAGHTRYAAMRKLGLTEAPVIVATDLTEERAREFRLVDNRSGEFSDWDYETLADEVADLDGRMITALFDTAGTAAPDPDDVLGGEEDSPATRSADPDNTTELICPSCFHGWQAEITDADLVDGRISPKGATA